MTSSNTVEICENKNAELMDADQQDLIEFCYKHPPLCSVTFIDEHKPGVQTYKVIWRDAEDQKGFEAGHNIAPMLQKWICEAMQHIYAQGPRPTLEPYIRTIGPKEITAPI